MMGKEELEELSNITSECMENGFFISEQDLFEGCLTVGQIIDRVVYYFSNCEGFAWIKGANEDSYISELIAAACKKTGVLTEEARIRGDSTKNILFGKGEDESWLYTSELD